VLFFPAVQQVFIVNLQVVVRRVDAAYPVNLIVAHGNLRFLIAGFFPAPQTFSFCLTPGVSCAADAAVRVAAIARNVSLLLL
jgi:hypothetical protein